MNQAYVSLEEVFAAAAARAASLVPETSGYLSLAVADATSRLPYVHDDRAVLLTVDGSVMVPRKGAVTAPPEAARGLRDLLRRLLATSTGSMPGLVAAARAREGEQDVDRVVGDIEAALIPVNRAAAKRALARLSRETLRAKELGKLKKKPAPVVAPEPKVVVAAPPAPVVAAPEPSVAVIAVPPAPVLPAPEPMVVVAEPTPLAGTFAARVEPSMPVGAPPPSGLLVKEPELVVKVPEMVARELEIVARELDAAKESARPAPAGNEPAALTPTPFEVDVDLSATPTGDYHASEAPLAWTESDATIADPEAMAVIEAVYGRAQIPLETVELEPALHQPIEEPSVLAPARQASAEARTGAPAPASAANSQAKGSSNALTPIPPSPPIPSLARARRAPLEFATPSELTAAAPQAAMFTTPETSRADELLHAFRAEDQGDPAVLAAASSLRAFAGIDDSPGPRAAGIRAPSSRSPAMDRRAAPAFADDDELLPVPPPRPREAARSRWPLAIFALGILVLFAAWLYRPTLAQDFFGLRRLVAPAPAPAAAPARAADAAPEPAAPAAPAIPARSRDTRAEGGNAEGTRRRRD